MTECKDLSKTRDFFFGVFCLLFWNQFVHHDGNVFGTDGHRCWRSAAAWSLLIGVCICDVGECERAGVSEWFSSPPPTQIFDTTLNSNKVFGAGQLDVAAKAVSASFDTLWYLKGLS